MIRKRCWACESTLRQRHLVRGKLDQTGVALMNERSTKQTVSFSGMGAVGIAEDIGQTD